MLLLTRILSPNKTDLRNDAPPKQDKAPPVVKLEEVLEECKVKEDDCIGI